MMQHIGLSVFIITQTLLTLSYGEVVKFDESFDLAWSVSSGRMLQPKCVSIPTNMSLCHSIGYDTMRIPNLLEHDNLGEATTQAMQWNPLLGIRCHPDTQVFLCSLFAPICLERVVYPCRSLCDGVQKGCEGYMKGYGFPWPEMFKCDQFPDDNDLCIPGRSSTTAIPKERTCKPCQEPDTYEGILHNYCKANYVVRATIKGLNKQSTTAEPGEIEVLMGKRKKRFYKRDEAISKKLYKRLQEKETKIYMKQGIGCTCGDRVIEGEHHLMGITVEEKYDRTGEKVARYYADFITSWNEGENTKPGVKKALRAIRKNAADVCQGGVDTLNIHKQLEDEDAERRSKKKERKIRKQRRHLDVEDSA